MRRVLPCLLLLLGLGCPADPPVPPFEWGTATAAFQIEGGNTSSDWAAWERRCVLDKRDGERSGGETITDCESNLDGPNAWELYEADYAEAEAMGHNAYRMGIEWAKIEPRPGEYDPQAIEHYHRMLAAARAHGLSPMVTLQHFTLPAWVNDIESPDGGLKGWAGEDQDPIGGGAIVEAFARYAGDMAEEFGGEVDLWVTINEPIVVLVGAYLAGYFPPGQTLQVRRTVRAAYNMAYAHARAYDAIHARDTDDADGDGRAAEVGIAKHWRVFTPADPEDASDVEAAEQLDYVFNDLFVSALTKGAVDLDADGQVEGPDERIDPDLAGHLDWLGVNYYSRYLVRGPVAEIEGVRLAIDFYDNPDPEVPKNDLGWEIYPEGLRQVLERATRYGLPLRITENGIADAADTKRAAFLVAHLQVLDAVRAAGIDVRGYYHWSLIDNFEWIEGYAPRFGLLEVDYDDPARRRIRRPSADVYTEIIAAGHVTEALAAEHSGFH